MPIPALQTNMTLVPWPCTPVVDVHTHLNSDNGAGWDNRPVSELLSVLDQLRVKAVVDLDGGWSENILNQHLDYFKSAAPERFAVFGGVDWEEWAIRRNAFPDWAAKRLRIQSGRGADGLKIWKIFGLHVKNPEGNVAAVDDPRLDVIWETAGNWGFRC